MKTKIIAIIMGAALAQYSSVALGATTKVCMASACGNSESYTEMDLTFGCAKKTYTCYGNTKLASCLSCTNSKATLTNQQIGMLPDCSGTYTFKTCQCPSCTGCSSTDWTSSSTGYEEKVTASCDCGECKKSTSYRCAAGYYGTSTNGSTGCSKCPTSGGVAGQSAAGSTEITSCYIPSNTTLSDSTGTYQYTSNCYYSK